mgnify:CR=1 FL=1
MIVGTPSSKNQSTQSNKLVKGNKIFLIYVVKNEAKPSNFNLDAWIHLHANSTLDFTHPRIVYWFQTCYALIINTSSSSSIIHSKPNKLWDPKFYDTHSFHWFFQQFATSLGYWMIANTNQLSQQVFIGSNVVNILNLGTMLSQIMKRHCSHDFSPPRA